MSDLSRRDIEHDNPEFRRLDEMVHRADLWPQDRHARRRDRGALLPDLRSALRDQRADAPRRPRSELISASFGAWHSEVLECQRWHSPGGSAKKTANQTRSRGRFPAYEAQALGDRVIVKAIEEEETTASGIVPPDTAKEKPQRGKVARRGQGKWDEDGEKRIPLDVAEGDEVLYSKYGGTEINVEGDDLLVLRESDVLAKVAG